VVAVAQKVERELILINGLKNNWESLIIQNLPQVNGVGLPRIVRLNPKTRGKLRR
jgi:hypothetical protein